MPTIIILLAAPLASKIYIHSLPISEVYRYLAIYNNSSIVQDYYVLCELYSVMGTRTYFRI